MKIRSGFVSNSSSSSFILDREHVTPTQIKLIYQHLHQAHQDGLYDNESWNQDEDAWHISETHDYIMGSTMMDNFDMRHYLRHIGVLNAAVTFEDRMADWHPYNEDGDSPL